MHNRLATLPHYLQILGFESREALAVRRSVQFVGVLLDDVRRRVRVVGEPALEARDLGQRVDEDAAALDAGAGRRVHAARGRRARGRLAVSCVHNGPITIAIRARFEYDSSTIRLQHDTTRYEGFRALAYEIVYENQ